MLDDTVKARLTNTHLMRTPPFYGQRTIVSCPISRFLCKVSLANAMSLEKALKFFVNSTRLMRTAR